MRINISLSTWTMYFNIGIIVMAYIINIIQTYGFGNLADCPSRRLTISTTYQVSRIFQSKF